METSKKENCCQDCENGNPGQNESCAAKLILDSIKQKVETNKSEVL
ncbi:hypothetical protein [Patiriisocius marinus]|uniref:Uncharacterized protein n=1 Tax=Patiriisocius marinus TaxID=1397112 RepID=A0A5J4IXA9_9FLAO|nr:hypothetical protein [Patiriisocius marinus]GER58093.1 hypothetical protein ULMA_02010 [Patiriisocius marinus]